MILPLRRVHRSVFVGLAILLPALLASAWKVRRAPILGELAEDLMPAAPTNVSGTEELVYWVANADLAQRLELPGDATFVGTVRSGALALIPPVGMSVVTYSLPHGLLKAPLVADIDRMPEDP